MLVRSARRRPAFDTEHITYTVDVFCVVGPATKDVGHGIAHRLVAASTELRSSVQLRKPGRNWRGFQVLGRAASEALSFDMTAHHEGR